MLKRYTLGVLGLAVIISSVAQAATDWDAKIRAQLALPTSQGVTLGVTAAAPLVRREVTMALYAARAHWDELSPETQQLASRYLFRPYPAQAVINDPGFSEQSWAFDVPEATPVLSSGGHFKIHYISAVTYPANTKASTAAYVTKVAEVLEQVYAAEIGTLGYDTVPSDLGAKCSDNSSCDGGDGTFDVYLTNLGNAGLYGYAAPEGANSDATRPYGEYSFLVLDNDYSKIPYGYDDYTLPLKVTAAHEYFHAVQFGYSAQELGSGFSFLEQSATWMEDAVYPTIHDNYFYIGEPYTDSDGNGQFTTGEPFVDRNNNKTRDEGSMEYPEASLDAFDDVPLIQYGRFIWFTYLTQNYGNGIVKTILQKCGQVQGDNMISAINESLQGFGTTIGAAYQDYATWNYDLSKFNDGSNYPLVYVDQTASGNNFKFTSAGSPSLNLWGSAGYQPQMHLSTVYDQIKSPSGTIAFASSGGTAALTMLVDFGGGILDAQVVSLTNGDGVYTVPSGAQKVIAVISNISTTVDRMQWTLTGSGYTEPPAKSKKNDSFFGAFGLSDLMLVSALGMYLRRRERSRLRQAL